MIAVADESVEDATRRSIKAAHDLDDLDAGAVAVLLELARAIDVMAANDGLRPDGKLDNVSVPTYLRFCESLGLTPAGRARLTEKKPEGAGGKLAVLQGQAQGRRKRTA